MELTDEKLAAWDGACEDPICVECGDEYVLRDGEEYTPMCDRCAQATVPALIAEIRRLRKQALTPATVERVMELVDRACKAVSEAEIKDEWGDEVGAQLAENKRRNCEAEIRRILSGDHILDAGKKVVSDE